MNLEQYFRKNFESNIIDHELRCHVKNGKTTFYIHPHNAAGETLDYTVKDNRLIPILPKEPKKAKDKTSGRFFAPITPEELASKITGAFLKYNKTWFDSWAEDYAMGNCIPRTCIEKSDGYRIPWRDLSSKINKDLSKCEFDFENVNCTDGYGHLKSITGFKTLPNGMTYLGICAGGDWENSVFFILYYSGSELRAYIPTEGNTWNTDTKSAYGNGEYKTDKEGKMLSSQDNENAKKRFGVEEYEYAESDPKKIIEDIMTRIKPRS